jgi:hypothetical protein
VAQRPSWVRPAKRGKLIGRATDELCVLSSSNQQDDHDTPKGKPT